MSKSIKKIKCPKCQEKSHDWNDVYQSKGSILTKVNALYIGWCQTNKEYLLSSEEDINVEINQELSNIFLIQSN